MEKQNTAIPNYYAYLILIIFIIPLIMIEFNNQYADKTHAFFNGYKSYFGFVLLFQLILFAFVFFKFIMDYDRFSSQHKSIGLLFNLIIGSGLFFQSIAWLGYFNGGLYFFEWLNK